MAKQQPTAKLEWEPTDDADGISIARDILRAAELSTKARVTKKEAVTPLCYAYWKHARKDKGKNMDDLLVNLVPKALSLLDKYKANDAESDIEKAEHKAIAELEDLLDTAMEEAGIMG